MNQRQQFRLVMAAFWIMSAAAVVASMFIGR